MKRILIIFILVIILGIFFIRLTLDNNIDESRMEVLAQNLDTPWAIDFLPDERIIFTERGGKVSIFDNELKVIGNIKVSEVSES